MGNTLWPKLPEDDVMRCGTHIGGMFGPRCPRDATYHAVVVDHADGRGILSAYACNDHATVPASAGSLISAHLIGTVCLQRHTVDGLRLVGCIPPHYETSRT